MTTKKKIGAPCKDCICLPVCKSETSLLVLLHKCSLLREVYNYHESYIGDNTIYWNLTEDYGI